MSCSYSRKSYSKNVTQQRKKYRQIKATSILVMHLKNYRGPALYLSTPSCGYWRNYTSYSIRLCLFTHASRAHLHRLCPPLYSINCSSNDELMMMMTYWHPFFFFFFSLTLAHTFILLVLLHAVCLGKTASWFKAQELPLSRRNLPLSQCHAQHVSNFSFICNAPRMKWQVY